ncbi:type II RES/Xre toxin-antitoxin system antitoxin [Antarcticimicrobium sediminis]|uniref:DUF2384 domain-containing protein n=1 Tax=Antarcticimicrobium sediminis TaxID=2546227 RepID=A0A4R5ELC0_9RHOB|nr:antitoxin Xre/MbcA/ParS toxin-binding domain-containing protein [Antarcticimicrobium sediminis]TDE35445.1 DUF2384 domain-containing protein [Antarcticimicrobium sediminis]
MVAATFQRDEEKVPEIDADAIETENTERAYQLLGGRRVIKHQVRTSLDAHDMIVNGISSQALVHLVDTVNFLSSGDALNKAIGMSLRTLQRKKSDKGKGRLSAEYGSRAWRFAMILARATTVLGDQDSAESWMLAPAIGLDNRRPIDLLSSAVGAEAVEDYLALMEYGGYT